MQGIKLQFDQESIKQLKVEFNNIINNLQNKASIKIDFKSVASQIDQINKNISNTSTSGFSKSYEQWWQKALKNREIKEEKLTKDYEQWWLKALKTREIAEDKLREKQKQEEERQRIQNESQIKKQQSKRNDERIKEYEKQRKLLLSNAVGGVKQELSLEYDLLGASPEKSREIQTKLDRVRNKNKETLKEIKKDSELFKQYLQLEEEAVENARIKKYTYFDKFQSKLDGKGQVVATGVDTSTFDMSRKELEKYLYSVTGNIGKVTGFKKELDGAGNSVIKMTYSTKNARNEIEKEVYTLDKSTKALYKNSEAVDKDDKSHGGFVDRLKNAFVAVASFATVTTGFYAAISQIKNGIQFVSEMDNALTDLNKVVDMTAEQMYSMKMAALEMGKELGKSSTEIMKGMAEWGRVTKDLNEIRELTKTSTMAANVTDLSVADASKALSTSMINFKIQAKDSMSVLDQLNEIQNNYKASAKDIAEGLAEVGGAAQQSGVKIQEMEGYLTALISSQGIQGSEAGTALKSFISRTYRIGAEGEEDAGKTEETLKSMGIAIRDSKNEFVDFSKILTDVSSKWNTYNRNQQIALAQSIGG